MIDAPFPSGPATSDVQASPPRCRRSSGSVAVPVNVADVSSDDARPSRRRGDRHHRSVVPGGIKGGGLAGGGGVPGAVGDEGPRCGALWAHEHLIVGDRAVDAAVVVAGIEARPVSARYRGRCRCSGVVSGWRPTIACARWCRRYRRWRLCGTVFADEFLTVDCFDRPAGVVEHLALVVHEVDLCRGSVGVVVDLSQRSPTAHIAPPHPRRRRAVEHVSGDRCGRGAGRRAAYRRRIEVIESPTPLDGAGAEHTGATRRGVVRHFRCFDRPAGRLGHRCARQCQGARWGCIGDAVDLVAEQTGESLPIGQARAGEDPVRESVTIMSPSNGSWVYWLPLSAASGRETGASRNFTVTNLSFGDRRR